MRIIVILPDRAKRAAFVTEGNNDPRFKIIGDFASLSEAYANTEPDPPDLTIYCKDARLQPEFPMFDALLTLVGSKPMTIHKGAGIETVAPMFGLPAITALPVATAPIVSRGSQQRLVAIGASTTGIEAFSQVLSGYPVNCPPTVIVQHIKSEYLAGLVDRLDHLCPADVVVGEPQMKLRPGQVVFAPGSPSHMAVQAGTMGCIFVDRPKVSGHRLSVDVLFHSVVHLSG